MHNSAIADNFSMLAKLMDIHGENSFKAKSYSSAAFTIEKLPVQLATLSPEKIFLIRGIGDAIGKKIMEQIATGRLPLLDEYIEKTPPGILEMLHIKGIGPKKIFTIWKSLEVESIGELLYACQENRLTLYKGFGQKTQDNIQQAITFYLSNQGSYLFAQVEQYALEFTKRLHNDFAECQFLLTGDFRQHALVIDKLEWVTDVDGKQLETYFAASGHTTETNDDYLLAKGPENIALYFYPVPASHLVSRRFGTSASPLFLEEWNLRFGDYSTQSFTTEKQFFEVNNIAYIPPYLREVPRIITLAIEDKLPQVIEPGDVQGIIHTHSNWSDGSNTIEEMARGAMEKGYKYVVISDHSKTASYANGLYPDRIKAQHLLIDELNEKLSSFKIFKSIESDILTDGSLDYDESVLSSFDLVIASVHSNLKMSEEKAMMRLLKAIANPYTTILGHLTGRLLLSRNGYPVDYDTIIDACAEYQVAIELNAHPRRLDMDWKWIDTAVSKGVLISIDPDSHAVEGYNDVRYGVLAAQKGGLTKNKNLSSFSLPAFEEFLAKQRLKRVIV